MDYRLDIQRFIADHANWEELLSNPPYSLVVSKASVHGHKLMMLKYNQCESDFHYKLVRECRGLVLDEDTLEPVSFPFYKFFNAHEELAADIEWQSAKVADKIDGSLIKIVNLDGNLLISTNGTLNAFDAPVAKQAGCSFKSFGEIVQHVLSTKCVGIDDFAPGWTYMFELVSPFTKVVIPYNNTDLFYLGRRDNNTFQEEHFIYDPFKGKFKLPSIHPITSLAQCIKMTSRMPWNEEGYVVCDDKFNRIKVKSMQYLMVHRLHNNGVMSYFRALDVVKANEIDEICAYFEELRPGLEKVKSDFCSLVDNANIKWQEFNNIRSSLPTRKEQAAWILNNFKYAPVAFALLDNKTSSTKEYFMNLPNATLMKILGYKNNNGDI